MRDKFYPAMQKRLNNNEWILIYPEEEMWFNYKKPRPLKPGAYHFAIKYSVPIIPCFVEMRERDEYDESGFKKLKFVLHIMPIIRPDSSMTLKEKKELMQKKDYECKVDAYEKAYGKKLDYTFENWDIGGFSD